MKRFVLDCSVTVAWCLPTTAGGYVDAVLELFETAEAHVPSIWPLEVANVLVVAERQRRLATHDTVQFLSRLGQLRIRIEEATPRRAWGPILTLARAYQLSSYDACYLELAIREGLALATLDHALRRAARAARIPLI